MPLDAPRGPLVVRAITDRRVVHIPDFDVAADVPEFSRASAQRFGYRSLLIVPMLREAEPVGAIGVNRVQSGLFSDSEIAFLQMFIDQAVIAIESVRLFKEHETLTHDLTRSVDQLTALGEVGQAVSSSLDLETVLTTIVSRAVQLSRLDGGTVFEYDQASEEFVQRATTGTARVLPGRAVVRKGEGGEEGGGHRPRPGPVPEVRRATRGQDLGHESGGAGFDVHVHAAGAP
jgi:GAF domain-containing protein